MTPAPAQKGVIPPAAWVVAACLFLLVLFLDVAACANRGLEPEFVLFPVIGMLLAGYIVLVGYVHGDAKRRRMRYVLWTWLAILVPNGIGIILYFILRDPLPIHCSKCGASAHPAYAFCPRCGQGIAPACPQCKRVVQTDWLNCPYCGTRLR